MEVSDAIIRKAKFVAILVLFFLFVRYAYFPSFSYYPPNVLGWQSIRIFIETICLCYIFVIYAFPHTIYKRRYLHSILFLLISHIIVYEINYLSLYTLFSFSIIDDKFREWEIYSTAGVFGFINNTKAAVYSFLWSYPFVIILLTIKAFRDIVRLRTENYRTEQARLRLELDFLKAQVNPHFLFNTLNSVYARIFEADQPAANLVLHLSELMRYNLYETDQPLIGLDKELAYIQNYLDLERNRLAGHDVLIDYEQSGGPAHYQIAPLLLIAFVENAFKHGVKGATQPAYVQVRAELYPGGRLTFTVENSLPERRQAPAATGVRSGGVVRRRLDALYAAQYALTTQADEKAYTVTLTVYPGATNAVVKSAGLTNSITPL